MKKLKLLIVEDEALTAICLKMEFEGEGFIVCETAPDGETALALYHQQNPDIILMDIRLAKGTNGIETSKSIKAYNPDLPIILMTGYDDEETLEEARTINPLDVIIKPVDVTTITKVIADFYRA